MSQLYYEDVKVDDEMEPLERTPTTDQAIDFFGRDKPTNPAFSDIEAGKRVGVGDEVKVSLQVGNTGERAGDEVVQLYLRQVGSGHGRALKELRGFQRIALQPGESRKVEFAIVPERDLRFYDEQGKRYAVDPGAYEVQVGASSADIRARATFEVDTGASQ